jgi:hypothetical protein
VWVRVGVELPMGYPCHALTGDDSCMPPLEEIEPNGDGDDNDNDEDKSKSDLDDITELSRTYIVLLELLAY